MSRTTPLADPKTEFEKTLDALIQVLLKAKAHLTIGRGIGQMVTDEPVISHVAPVFWGFTIYAHFDAAQLYAFKLFDQQRGTITIERLLSIAERNPQIFPHGSQAQLTAKIVTARRQILGMDKSLEKIDAVRNGIIAHMDQTFIHDPVKLAAETRVTFTDLNIVFMFTESILNELAAAFRGTVASFDLVDVKDYQTVGRWIVLGKCAHIKEYESRWGPWTEERPKNCPE